MEAFVGSLSSEELIALCVGKVHEDFSIIGNASATVPGAAGDSTDSLVESRKIPSVIMADGPAGLRLTREFKVDVEGKVIGDSGFILPKVMQDAMEESEGRKEKKEAKEVYYQYCTAIPVATLLAQSWDMELIEQCGSRYQRRPEAPGYRNHY